MIVAKLVPSLVEDGGGTRWMVPAFGPLLCCVLIVVWWLVASRARWHERLFGLLGLVAGVLATLATVDKSMHGPAITIVTIPMGMAAFVIGLTACSRMPSFRRTLIAVLLAACGFGFSNLLRAGGMWGDFGLELSWRWRPSAEEKLLASKVQASKAQDQAHVDQKLPAQEFENSSLESQWPAFRGSDRSGRQRGSLLATDWTKDRPELLWKTPVGPGWSSFSVAGDLLFTQEQRGTSEAVVCYHAQTGREIWTQQTESRFDDPLGGPGPRATPTLAGGQIFAMGAQGYLWCLHPTTGAVVWKQDVQQVADRQPPMWGFSSSPLVVAGVVIVHAGGAGDKGVLAFDSVTGALRWSAASGDHSYSSPQLCEVLGESLAVMLTNTGLVLLDPETGQVRLNYEWAVQGYRALQPQMVGQDSMLIPTGMGSGIRRVRMAKAGTSCSAEEEWYSRSFQPEFNDFVVYQGHFYGFDGAIFSCVELDTGKRVWKGGRYGKGQVLLVEDSGLLLIASEQGDVVLVRADSSGHSELAKIKAIEGKTWNHPVLIGDKLYLRNAQEAACYRLPLAAPLD